MKKFWLVLLSLGLIAAFGTQAMAVDLKFSGEYYAAGMYMNRVNLQKDAGPSTAFYYQRLRVRTDFVVSPGLTFITRFDAMERAWGAARSAAGTALDADSAGSVAENENLALDWAYINYKAAIGAFDVGYMNDGTTGTIFGNSYAPYGRMKYSYSVGPATLNLAYTKVKEQSSSAKLARTTSDLDNDKYGIEGVYTWKNGKAGLNVNYYNYAETRTAADPYKRTYYVFTPYVIAKIGPVALQAEYNYLTGDQKYEAPSALADKDLRSMSGWVDATADLGMFYVGGSVAYAKGDSDPNDNKIEDGLNGGRDWQPCLIMWNYERTYWAGALAGYNGAAQDTNMTNAWLYQVRGGVRPVAKLDIKASVSYAVADRKRAFTDDKYGYEMDLTATYKITNNLSYMLGGGYLKAGDYYKGINAANNVDNNYLLINKLTLTF